MITRERLEGILQDLPEHRVQEVLDFARFLRSQEDREAWQEFGRQQLARAYGEDEPDYGLDDVKPELQQ
jgi:hypothetical protein